VLTLNFTSVNGVGASKT